MDRHTQKNGEGRPTTSKARREGGPSKRGWKKGGPRRKKPRIPPPVFQKAKSLQERTGLPFREAVEVASGRMTVQQALKQLLAKEKLQTLVQRGELHSMFVPSVIGGTMDLERAKKVTRLLADEAWRGKYSILETLNESGEKRVFYHFGRPPMVATVPKLTKYDVWLLEEGTDEPLETQKHNLLYACRVEERGAFEAAMGRDEKVAALGLGASTSYKDRFRSDKEVLYDLHRDGREARVVFRDGTVLVGRVGWFGRWEFELIVSEDCRPVVFRHAMYALEPVS